MFITLICYTIMRTKNIHIPDELVVVGIIELLFWVWLVCLIFGIDIRAELEGAYE